MRRLHHVALGTPRVERLAAFYAQVFELPEVARHHLADGSVRSIWLDLAGTILMIEHSAAEPQPVTGIGAGPFLLALDVTPSERQALEARLLAADAAIESRSAFTSYARDPDGNRIGISHYPAAASASESGTVAS